MTDTLRVVIDEIRTTIKQTFDDKEVSRAQAAFWVIIVANRLLGQHNGKRDSGQFLVPFPDVPVEVADDNSERGIIKGRKFVRLPGNIFDFNRDGGVGYMSYYNPDENCEPELYKKVITRTTPAEIQWLESNFYAKPSPKNPYWYRAGEIIYIVGIESVPVKFAELGLYLTIDPLEKIDIDKPFFFPQELMEVLKRQVVDLARYSFLFKKDTANDGTDEASNPASQNIPKIASVNQNNEQ